MPADPREDAPLAKRLRKLVNDLESEGRFTAAADVRAASRALSAQPSGEGEREPAHRRVTEYDGAYWCLDCGAQWGALPGKPQMPARCSAAPTSPPASAAPADGGEALRERLIDALNMERYWTGGLDPTETFVDRFLASLSRSPVSDDSNGGGA